MPIFSSYRPFRKRMMKKKQSFLVRRNVQYPDILVVDIKNCEKLIMNQNFRKSERMHRREEISHMFHRARRAGDNLLMLLAWYNENNGLAVRGGVTVSVRHGNAVQRNRIKRLCREAFRLEKKNLQPGYDFILAPRKGAKLDVQGLRDSISRLAGKITKPNGKNYEKGAE